MQSKGESHSGKVKSVLYYPFLQESSLGRLPSSVCNVVFSFSSFRLSHLSAPSSLDTYVAVWGMHLSFFSFSSPLPFSLSSSPRSGSGYRALHYNRCLLSCTAKGEQYFPYRKALRENGSSEKRSAIHQIQSKCIPSLQSPCLMTVKGRNGLLVN